MREKKIGTKTFLGFGYQSNNFFKASAQGKMRTRKPTFTVPPEVKKAGKVAFKTAQRIGRDTIRREIKRAKSVKKMKYPENLGLHHDDINTLTDF